MFVKLLGVMQKITLSELSKMNIFVVHFKIHNTMKRAFLLFATFFLCSKTAHSQPLSLCQVEVWKGRKINYQIDKIAAYTGKDFKNAPIELFWGYSEKIKVWKKDSRGILCLADSTLSDTIYRVKDTVNCRDFNLTYIVSYRDLISKG
jgi:hypothetical protein